MSDTNSHPGGDVDDADLYRLLQDAKFEGPVWDRVSVELARYAIQVCRPMIGTGKIFERCRESGRGLRRPPRALSGDEVESLTVEVVGEGILAFQEALRRGKWLPSGPAKMTTSLVNYCIGEFPNVWRRRLRHDEAYWRAVEVAGEQAAQAGHLGASVSHASPGQWVDLWDTLLDEVPDPTLRKIVVLESMGYRHAEIATIVGGGLTAAAVTERLGRHRRRRRQREGGAEE
jgi:hypothetical protein